MRISVELIPRSEDDLWQQLAELKSFPRVDTVNIPDISRFELRSWQGCFQARQQVRQAIPHLRAIDFDPGKPLKAVTGMVERGIEEVLVVTGDAPADMSRPVFPTTSVELIRRLRDEHPELTVYAAFDPYRQGFAAEQDYALEKLEAGAAGLFTQPFFDVRMMALFADLLRGVTVFWGVTTVTSSRSRQYWQNRNHVVFPPHFAPTLAWNRRLAREALAFVEERDDNIYFMPIRTSIAEYLSGIL